MRARLAIALGAAALAATAAVPSQAAAKPPTLDGKKVKKITKTVSPETQDHDDDQVTSLVAEVQDKSSPSRTDCKMPRCYRLDFVFSPAKGVKGKVLFKVSWTNPASDVDLFVSDERKASLESCGGGTGTSETIVMNSTRFRPGKRYTLVADFYRTIADTVTMTVEFPTSVTIKQTVPDTAELVYPVNCTLQ